jgi:hypothetical protein
MKKLFLLILFLISGCDYISQFTFNQNQPILEDCNQTADILLASENIEPLNFNNEEIIKSGIARQKQAIGYIFQGESGQKLNYQTDDNICILIYTPDNQILTSKELPKTGQYIIQIYTTQGSQTFDIKLSLESKENPISSQPSPRTTTRKTYQFSFSDFPKNTCGDRKPTDPNAYPVKFYPVNIPYSESNLSQAQSLFCRDSFQKRHPTTREKIIQISSFLEQEKAQDFADFVSQKIAGASVGEPTTIYQ